MYVKHISLAPIHTTRHYGSIIPGSIQTWIVRQGVHVCESFRPCARVCRRRGGGGGGGLSSVRVGRELLKGIKGPTFAATKTWQCLA